MKIDLKIIGIFTLAFACLGGVGSAQDLKLEFDGDKSLLNDVQIDTDGGLRRATAPDQSLINDVDAQVLPPVPGQAGARWIGVGVAPIPEVLRSHLNVSDGMGVMVDQVVPNSPAANAGLKRHDVLISAGGSAVSSVPRPSEFRRRRFRRWVVGVEMDSWRSRNDFERRAGGSATGDATGTTQTGSGCEPTRHRQTARLAWSARTRWQWKLPRTFANANAAGP